MAEIVEHQRQMGESAHLPNLTLSNYPAWECCFSPLLACSCLPLFSPSFYRIDASTGWCGITMHEEKERAGNNACCSGRRYAPCRVGKAG
jgi:hypothetical protein